jgi:spore coat polysaccharide biosynthesis protein SpsF
VRTVAIVQARLGSSRLPGKSLAVLAGRSLISHVLERARAIRGLDAVVLATTVSLRDNALVDEGRRCGVEVLRGSEWDVLDRLLCVALVTEAEVVMRLTGDCPLLCPLAAEQVLALHAEAVVQAGGGEAYAWNDTLTSGYPDGTDVEVFSAGLLSEADAMATSRPDREHVTPYIRRTHAVARLANIVDQSRYKLSVDTPEDLEFVRAVYACLPPGRFALADTMDAVSAAECRRATAQGE